MTSIPRAILFDLDGVIIKPKDYYFQSWARIARDEGLSLTYQEYNQFLRGTRKRDALRYLTRGYNYSEAQFLSILERKKCYFLEEITRMTEADLTPGVRRLLNESRQAGIKTAIASAGKYTRQILEQLALLDAFDGIADALSIARNKPAADVYIFAAGLVNVPVAACLAIDDKADNVRDIKRVGMHALGIGEKDHFHPDDLVLPTLAHVCLSDILFICQKISFAHSNF